MLNGMTTKALLDLAAAHRYSQDRVGEGVRKRAGLSMSKVARTVGVTGQSVKNWETGKCLPSGRHATRWVQLLDALVAQERAAEAAAPKAA